MAARFSRIVLEMVRPGPSRNQLLSPLTHYMALCGDGAPITMNIAMEHQQLLDRLEQTRYFTRGGPGTATEIPDRLRQSALSALAEDMAGILKQTPSLLFELGQIRGGDERQGETLVHLRLRLGGSELSLLPFELALAPQAFPGEGLELCLQSTLKVVPTREIRRSRPLPVSWNHPDFRVLMITAAPGTEVPEREHARELRRAVEPWVGWPARIPAGAEPRAVEIARLGHVKQRLRILRDASIEDIKRECGRERYSHIHILAHGDHRSLSGENRFGLALCDSSDRQKKQVVSGDQLAKALLTESADGSWRSQPVVVSLATCDSGNGGSVLVRGGSVAHDLHVEGVPWVFASQFPLTFGGSVRMVEELYPRLLRGDDPRVALFETRRRLYVSSRNDHDWASLVAYASVPDDLEEQVGQFFEEQTRRAVDVGLQGVDRALTGKATVDGGHVQRLERSVRGYLDLWRNRMPMGTEFADRERRAECLGIHGSAFKRFGLLLKQRARVASARTTASADEAAVTGSGTRTQEENRKADEALHEAWSYYRDARDQRATRSTKHHWTLTQYLSLSAVLDTGRDEQGLREAMRLARVEVDNPDPSERAWAFGTLAELELVSLYHDPEAEEAATVARAVAKSCREIVKLAGPASFQVKSTERQFRRYRDYWQDPRWDKVVRAALRGLQH